MDSAQGKAARGAMPWGNPRRKRLPWDGDHEEGITNKITSYRRLVRIGCFPCAIRVDSFATVIGC